VLAVGDVSAVEIGAELFRRMAALHPEAIEKIGLLALERKAGLDQVRTAAAGAATVETRTLMTRMRKFLGL
jgi:hypothetical protein